MVLLVQNMPSAIRLQRTAQPGAAASAYTGADDAFDRSNRPAIGAPTTDASPILFGGRGSLSKKIKWAAALAALHLLVLPNAPRFFDHPLATGGAAWGRTVTSLGERGLGWAADRIPSEIDDGLVDAAFGAVRSTWPKDADVPATTVGVGPTSPARSVKISEAELKEMANGNDEVYQLLLKTSEHPYARLVLRAALDRGDHDVHNGAPGTVFVEVNDNGLAGIGLSHGAKIQIAQRAVQNAAFYQTALHEMLHSIMHESPHWGSSGEERLFYYLGARFQHEIGKTNDFYFGQPYDPIQAFNSTFVFLPDYYGGLNKSVEAWHATLDKMDEIGLLPYLDDLVNAIHEKYPPEQHPEMYIDPAGHKHPAYTLNPAIEY